MSMGGIYPRVDWLQRLVMTTVENQLCQGPPHRTGLISAGLCFPLSVPLSVTLVQVALGLPRKCTPMSAITCVLPGATQYVL